MEMELKSLKEIYPFIKDVYNELNVENVEKARAQAAKDLKANEQQSTKLGNQLQDESSILAKYETELAKWSAGTPEFTAATTKRDK